MTFQCDMSNFHNYGLLYLFVLFIFRLPRSFVLQVLRTVDANEMILTAVSMSHSGRMLFAGTSTGTLRSMKFPLTVPGEWTEYQGHGSAILKVKQKIPIHPNSTDVHF